MAEASLDARSQGFAFMKTDMEVRIAPLRLISASSARMDVESFRLDLLPVWMSEVQAGGGAPPGAGERSDGGGVGGPGRRRGIRAKGDLLDWLGELVG